jgi:NADPH2:quinone reductase
MRAFALDDFGQPGSVRDLPLPEPGPNEIRVRVKAAGLNAFDVFVVSGAGKAMLKFEYPIVPGMDFSGIVDAVGPDADFGVGHEVFGVAVKPVFGRGSLAEFIVVPAAVVAPKPPGVEHLAAATFSVAGRTALAIRDALSPRPGQTVLLVGATGGVGSFTTQLLARAGATVVASVRPQNADYARALGAADVIDRTADDLATEIRRRHPGGIDAIVDLASDEQALTALAAVVRRGGTVISTLRSANDEVLAEHGLRAINLSAAPVERQAEVADLVARGEIRPPETRVFDLDRAGDALAEQATRHVRGKLVVTP